MGTPTPRRRLAAALVPVIFVAAGVAAITTATSHTTNATHQDRPSVGSSSDD